MDKKLLIEKLTLIVLQLRWPEAIPLLENIQQKTASDKEYAALYKEWINNGGTLIFRDIARPFGEYLNDISFCNNVNAIDTAYHMASQQEPDPVAYRLTRLYAGSEKYGDCEVCGSAVDSVYHLVEMRRYNRCSDGKESITYHLCFERFGHKDCVTDMTNHL